MAKTTELLAPAGNIACFHAALQAGADAVYLGGRQFGARAYAGNFSDEEILQVLGEAHFFGKKIYLTVNTLMKQEEIDRLKVWLAPFYEAGLDGVILQDLGVLRVCRESFPGLQLHASTQLTVTDTGAALLLKELGVSRIVPARELSLPELGVLKERTGMEIEVFIHGALCYAYSGQCLFSSLLGGRSGNRGRCAQPCRQPYRICKNEKAAPSQYPLSLKDLCTLSVLPNLLAGGIDSFKIEGRMKGPEYVAGVTAVYRKYIDLYTKDTKGWEIDKKDRELLEKLYVRSDIGEGYFNRYNGKEMITPDKPGYRGCSEDILEFIRHSLLDKKMTCPVNMKIDCEVGQPARLSASCIDHNGKHHVVGCEGMPVCVAQKKPLSDPEIKKQLAKTGASFFVPQQIEVNLQDGGFLPVSAINDLRRRVLEMLYQDVVRGAIPCRSKPEEKITGKGHKRTQEDTHINNRWDTQEYTHGIGCLGGGEFRVRALSRVQALAALQNSCVKRLYLSADALLLEKDLVLPKGEDGQEISSTFLIEQILARKTRDGNFSFYLTLPAILREYSGPWLKDFNGFLHKYTDLADGVQVCNLSGLAWLKQNNWNRGIALDASVYVWNRQALDIYEELAQIGTYTAPFELHQKEIWKLPPRKLELAVYGRTAMMLSANCVKKTADACKANQKSTQLPKRLPIRSLDTKLTDRYSMDFPVLTDCKHCMNTIYNAVPLSLHRYMDSIKAHPLQALRLDFTDEGAKEVKGLIDYFGEKKGVAPAPFTTGHFHKGAL